MWILQWLPSWIFYLILIIGLLGFLVTYLLKFIPLPVLAIYRTPIQIVSVVLIVIGVYMSGSIANNEAWEARVLEVKTQLAEAEARAQQENVRVVEKIVVQNKIIREQGQQVIKYVDREVVKYDTRCEIPRVFVDAQNQAAKGAK